MAKKLKVGDVIRGYRITKVFGPGMMAISYAALAPTGEKVFFKQYKSPAPSVVWYNDFVAYQKVLSSRVSSGKAANFAVAQLDAFEEVWGGPCYFQAYEFVENGADLQQMSDEERERHRLTRTVPTKDPAVWARHVTWAKVLVAGVAALHESGVVHADLKPANAYLLKDPSITAGYQLKLIDMDFSVLADRRAPWHGYQGYVGTDNYRSPEHLVRGSFPIIPSDVFTCGLMLYELLAGHHPYWSEDQGEYARLVQAYAARPPALLGPMAGPATNTEVSAALHRCLSPDPKRRPTAADLRAILSGRHAKEPTARAVADSVTSGSATSHGLRGTSLSLIAPGGGSIRVGIRTELGRALLRALGPDASYWDERQCVLERSSSGNWQIAPLSPTTNTTLLNGRTLERPHTLSAGDTIAVGSEAKGISKLPLTVKAS